MTIFKAYDIRGTVPEQLDEKLAYKIGRAFATFLKVKKVVVGHDMRISSPELFNATVNGITDQGCDVISIGLASTPMMYFAVAKFGYDAGINITASHNPKQYNGMKMVTKGALPLSGATGIKEIEKLAMAGEFKDPERKGTIMDVEVLQDYLKNMFDFVDTKDFKRFKIVVDAGNAMGGLVIPEMFKKLPCELIPLNLELDGTFPNHEPNPLVPENLVPLQEKVKETGADLGISIDGDADRIFFVDEKGDVIPADLLGARIAEIVMQKHPNATILYDLRSSMMTKQVIEKARGKAIQCRVGHSFIKTQMREENAVFGIELSAHYYMADNFYIESPYIVTLLLLNHLTKNKLSLSEYIAPLKKYYATGEINSEVEDKDTVLKKLEEEFSEGRTFHLDGLSVEFDDWWFNVRPSNTEPLLRLNLEARDAQKMKNMKEKVLGIIRGKT